MQSGVVPSMDQLRILRQNISRDERELSHLSAAQRQSKLISAQNDERRMELMGLQEIYSQDEQQLRHAVEKVDSLKKQVNIWKFELFPNHILHMLNTQFLCC